MPIGAVTSSLLSPILSIPAKRIHRLFHKQASAEGLHSHEVSAKVVIRLTLTMHIYRSNLLHTVEKLLVSARGLLSNSINTPENFAKIDTLERAFSVAQHHGTLVDTNFFC